MDITGLTELQGYRIVVNYYSSLLNIFTESKIAAERITEEFARKGVKTTLKEQSFWQKENGDYIGKIRPTDPTAADYQKEQELLLLSAMADKLAAAGITFDDVQAYVKLMEVKSNESL